MASGRDLGKSDDADDLVDFFRKYLGGIASSHREMRLYDCTNYKKYFCVYTVDSMTIIPNEMKEIITKLNDICKSIEKNNIHEVMTKIMPGDTNNIFLKTFENQTLLEFISTISDKTSEECKSIQNVSSFKQYAAKAVGINIQELFDKLTLLLNYLSRPENMKYIVANNQPFIIQMNNEIKMIDVQQDTTCDYNSYKKFKDAIFANFKLIESKLKNIQPMENKADLDVKLKNINEKIAFYEKIHQIPDDEDEIRDSLIRYYTNTYGVYNENTRNLLYKEQSQITSELAAANKEKNSPDASQQKLQSSFTVGTPEYIARQQEQYELLKKYTEEEQSHKLTAKKRGARPKKSRKKSTKKRKQRKSKKSRSKKI